MLPHLAGPHNSFCREPLSLTHSIMSPLFLRVSFSHSLPHTHTPAPRPLTQTLIIKLEGTQGQRFISFPKGKVENFN